MEKKTFIFALAAIAEQHHYDNNIRWGYNIDDPNCQKDGIVLSKDSDILPIVRFKYFGNTDAPAPPTGTHRHYIYYILLVKNHSRAEQTESYIMVSQGFAYLRVDWQHTKGNFTQTFAKL